MRIVARAGPAAEAAASTEYLALARAYDRRWRRYLQATVAHTLARLPGTMAGPVLDVGCGTGVLLDALLARRAGIAAHGVDLSPPMLQRAAARLAERAGLVAGSAQTLPFRDAAFGTVTSSSSLHYWADAQAGLAEIARVLRPGGTLVLTDWCADHPAIRLIERWLRLRGRAPTRAYRAAELAAALRRAGFGDVRVERYRVGWRWGMMTAVATRRDGAP
jgi:SAM-dependent methyltransferase